MKTHSHFKQIIRMAFFGGIVIFNNSFGTAISFNRVEFDLNTLVVSPVFVGSEHDLSITKESYMWANGIENSNYAQYTDVHGSALSQYTSNSLITETFSINNLGIDETRMTSWCVLSINYDVENLLSFSAEVDCEFEQILTTSEIGDWAHGDVEGFIEVNNGGSGQMFFNSINYGQDDFKKLEKYKLSETRTFNNLYSGTIELRLIAYTYSSVGKTNVPEPSSLLMLSIALFTLVFCGQFCFSRKDVSTSI